MFAHGEFLRVADDEEELYEIGFQAQGAVGRVRGRGEHVSENGKKFFSFSFGQGNFMVAVGARLVKTA